MPDGDLILPSMPKNPLLPSFPIQPDLGELGFSESDVESQEPLKTILHPAKTRGGQILPPAPR